MGVCSPVAQQPCCSALCWAAASCDGGASAAARWVADAVFACGGGGGRAARAGVLVGDGGLARAPRSRPRGGGWRRTRPVCPACGRRRRVGRGSPAKTGAAGDGARRGGESGPRARESLCAVCWGTLTWLGNHTCCLERMSAQLRRSKPPAVQYNTLTVLLSLQRSHCVGRWRRRHVRAACTCQIWHQWRLVLGSTGVGCERQTPEDYICTPINSDLTGYCASHINWIRFTRLIGTHGVLPGPIKRRLCVGC